MRDAVSDELDRRMAEPVHWRSALAAALVIHGAVAAAVLLGPAGRHRALTLPRVQVRIAPALPPVPGADGRTTPAGERTSPVRPVAPKPAPKSVSKPAAKPPAAAKRRTKPAEEPAGKTVAPSGRSAAPPSPVPPGPLETSAPGEGSGGAASGAVALGPGAGQSGTDETFPYGYYLNRVLAMIESNWFRPPAPPETRSRVLCRIDRSGRVTEVGIEEPSSSSAFDRAALRAVYAAAPFPPLPQGFGGNTLTLHLEFGAQ